MPSPPREFCMMYKRKLTDEEESAHRLSGKVRGVYLPQIRDYSVDGMWVVELNNGWAPVVRINVGNHNISRVQLTFWFSFDGSVWMGRKVMYYGDCAYARRVQGGLGTHFSVADNRPLWAAKQPWSWQNEQTKAATTSLR
jgi:hypothetical protein